jgi:hypothetical protein
MGMGRFSLKRLFASVTLVGVGLAIEARLFSHPEIYPLTQFLMSAFGGAFIGAGIFNPFGRPWAGAALGALIALPLAPCSLSNKAREFAAGEYLYRQRIF